MPWRLPTPLLRPLLLLLVVLLPLAGCQTPTRLDAVPLPQVGAAVLPGVPDARFFIDDTPESVAAVGEESVLREVAWLKEQGRLAGTLPTAHYIALSGGAEDGAFGAGLINGWTKAGTRPEFKLVTGISTGALMAPLVFLGPKYDPMLRAMYTDIGPQDVFLENYLLYSAFFGDGLFDPSPLAERIARIMTAEMLEEIAAEYDKGRLLFVATTNLDVARPVVWNLGAIAKAGGPQALKLVHQILLASAAIPGAFPPVMIDVTVDGRQYQEMHVDGGAIAQAFLYPPTLHIDDVQREVIGRRKRVAWLVRNGKLLLDPVKVDRSTLSIAGRAISAMIASQGVGDMYRIFAITQRDGVDFNLAYIGDDFSEPYEAPFDPTYLRALYQYGFEKAAAGFEWRKTPPGYAEPTEPSEQDLALLP